MGRCWSRRETFILTEFDFNQVDIVEVWIWNYFIFEWYFICCLYFYNTVFNFTIFIDVYDEVIMREITFFKQYGIVRRIFLFLYFRICLLNISSNWRSLVWRFQKNYLTYLKLFFLVAVTNSTSNNANNYVQ